MASAELDFGALDKAVAHAGQVTQAAGGFRPAAAWVAPFWDGKPRPCAATFFHVFRRLDHADLEARLGAWAQQVLAATSAAGSAALEPVALDGKTPWQAGVVSRARPARTCCRR